MKTISDVNTDVEIQQHGDDDLTNHSVRTLTWSNVNMKARKSSNARMIPEGINGSVIAGILRQIAIVCPKLIPSRRDYGNHGAQWEWKNELT